MNLYNLLLDIKPVRSNICGTAWERQGNNSPVYMGSYSLPPNCFTAAGNMATLNQGMVPCGQIAPQNLMAATSYSPQSNGWQLEPQIQYQTVQKPEFLINNVCESAVSTVPCEQKVAFTDAQPTAFVPFQQANTNSVQTQTQGYCPTFQNSTGGNGQNGTSTSMVCYPAPAPTYTPTQNQSQMAQPVYSVVAQPVKTAQVRSPPQPVVYMTQATNSTPQSGACVMTDNGGKDQDCYGPTTIANIAGTEFSVANGASFSSSTPCTRQAGGC